MIATRMKFVMCFNFAHPRDETTTTISMHAPVSDRIGISLSVVIRALNPMNKDGQLKQTNATYNWKHRTGGTIALLPTTLFLSRRSVWCFSGTVQSCKTGSYVQFHQSAVYLCSVKNLSLWSSCKKNPFRARPENSEISRSAIHIHGV